ncbi:m-AAA protease-interacting protein 1, mitochondrial [Brevipalpus obovatus]|uniref:m-AAA protease-interacting protein 1, mitochondrial n=1 Tax=Brevipalpus obovatus TaxID=246614 RepID=UPI003D9E99A8
MGSSSLTGIVFRSSKMWNPKIGVSHSSVTLVSRNLSSWLRQTSELAGGYQEYSNGLSEHLSQPHKQSSCVSSIRGLIERRGATSFGINPHKWNSRHQNRLLSSMKTAHFHSDITFERSYCTDQRDLVPRMPSLTGFDYSGIFPNPFSGLQCLFKSLFVVRPNIDNSFNLKVFCDGAKQAFLVITNKLANSDIAGLKELVTDSAFNAIQSNAPKLTAKHKRDLMIEPSNITGLLINNIEIIQGQDEKKFLQILVIYKIFKMSEKADSFAPGVGTKDFLYNNIISHLRFIREYKDGRGGDWLCKDLEYQYFGIFAKEAIKSPKW